MIITHADLTKLAPFWEEYTEHIETHADAKERLGWVREMYAYSIAAAATGIEHDVQARAAARTSPPARIPMPCVCEAVPSEQAHPTRSSDADWPICAFVHCWREPV